MSPVRAAKERPVSPPHLAASASSRNGGPAAAAAAGANEHSLQPPPQFPRAKVLLLASISMGNSASYLATYPFVAFMILDFFGEISDPEVGYYSGILEGSYHLGAFIGAIAWGAYADRYGRRPALLWGLLGTIFSCLIFGTARSFAVALLGRILWGVLNGNVGVVKTCLSEITDDVHTPRAFSWIGVATGAGRVVGPAIGGLLSQPVTKYPKLFGTSVLLREFPFLLPCLVTAVVTLLTLIPAYFILEETLPVELLAKRATAATAVPQPCGSPPPPLLQSSASAKKHTGGGGKQYSAVSDSEEHALVGGADDTDDDDDGDVQRVESVGDAGSVVNKYAKTPSNGLNAASNLPLPPPGELELPPSTLLASIRLSSGGISRSRSRGRSDAYSSVFVDFDGGASTPQLGPTTAPVWSSSGEEGGEEGGDGHPLHSAAHEGGKNTKKGAVYLPPGTTTATTADTPSTVAIPSPSSTTAAAAAPTWWTETKRLVSDPPVASAVALYSALGLVGLVSNEIFPLYVLNPPEFGGFSWSSTEIGLVAMEAGAPLIIFQAFVFDRIARSAGLLRTARWSLALFTLCMITTPACSLTLMASKEVQFAVISGHFCITTMCRVSSFTCVFVFVSNSASTEDRGKVNGIGQAAVSLVRMFGPPIFSSLFAWSVSAPHPFPFDFTLTWICMALMSVGTLAVTYALPPWIEKKRAAGV